MRLIRTKRFQNKLMGVVIPFIIEFMLVAGARYNKYAQKITTGFETYYFPTNIELHQNTRLVFNINEKQDTSSCKLCTFVSRTNRSNSTPRDVVIAVSIGKATNMIIFVKSLRTTGSKAQCVFLVDDVASNKISRLTRDIIKKCGGRIINCGNVPYKKYLDGHNYCYFFALSFLEANIDTFDRAIISDMYDTVFQGDPFTEQFSSEKFNIVDEGVTYDTFPTGPANREWLKPWNIYGPSKLKYYCTGYMGASTKILIHALRLFAMQHRFGEGRHDQAAFNYLYLSGILDKNGIGTVKERKNEEIRHLAMIPPPNKTLGYITSINSDKTYATAIHHYYAVNTTRNSIINFCPKEDPGLEDYLNRKKETFT